MTQTRTGTLYMTIPSTPQEGDPMTRNNATFFQKQKYGHESRLGARRQDGRTEGLTDRPTD